MSRSGSGLVLDDLSVDRLAVRRGRDLLDLDLADVENLRDRVLPRVSLGLDAEGRPDVVRDLSRRSRHPRDERQRGDQGHPNGLQRGRACRRSLNDNPARGPLHRLDSVVDAEPVSVAQQPRNVVQVSQDLSPDGLRQVGQSLDLALQVLDGPRQDLNGLRAPLPELLGPALQQVGEPASMCRGACSMMLLPFSAQS